MKAVVVKIENKYLANLLKYLAKFKGVESVSVHTEEELENISMLKACKAGMRTKNVSRADVMKALK